jgi:KaiC/GvpD/RAD55 family RecA-like ATPase
MASPSVKRISSGIEGFDAITSGGIPENTATMVYGPPKAGKSVFAYHFLAESLKVGEACIIVTTDYGAEDLVRSMSGFRWSIQDALNLGSIQLISMIPVTSSHRSEHAGLKAVSLANPTELMLNLNEILKLVSDRKLKFRTIWDSLTPLFIYNPPMLVAKILREFSSKMKKAGAVGILFTLVQGSIDSQSENIIKASVDNLVNLHADGKLVVEGMLGTPKATVAYSLTNMGFEVKTQ